MKIVVVGLGEIGGAVFEEIATHPNAFDLCIVGNDIDPAKTKPHDHFHYANTTYSNEIPLADFYIVCVWSTDQILNVIKQIETLNPEAVICIESTIDPSAIELIRHHRVVAFPHRFNPNDQDHKIFNLDRLIGSDDQAALNTAKQLFSRFMPDHLLHEVDFEIAVLAKVAENAYRALEIIMAQEIKKSCQRKGIDFESLRKAMNTKWNIDVREARDGVAGKCLPKDLGLFNKTFPDFIVGQIFWYLNEEFKNRPT